MRMNGVDMIGFMNERDKSFEVMPVIYFEMLIDQYMKAYVAGKVKQ